MHSIPALIALVEFGVIVFLYLSYRVLKARMHKGWIIARAIKVRAPLGEIRTLAQDAEETLDTRDDWL